MSLFRRKTVGWEASLIAVQRDLASAREDAEVAAAQLASLREDAEEAHLRSIVSENSGDVRDARHAAGHAERVELDLERVRERIEFLKEREHALLNTPLFDE